jgi:hypothetical protein
MAFKHTTVQFYVSCRLTIIVFKMKLTW